MKAYTGLTAAKYAKENHDCGKGEPLSDNDERYWVHLIMTLPPKTHFLNEPVLLAQK